MNAFFIFAVVFTLSACGKKDRLTAPTQIIRVSPTASAVLPSATKTFMARVFTPSGEAVDADLTWSLSPASAGSLAPTTGSQTVFTAGQALGVRGTITVSHEGLAGLAQVTVVPETGDAATAYGFFSESLPTGILLDTANPPNVNGGFLGTFSGGGGGISLSSVGGTDEFTEGATGLKVSVSGSGGGSFAGTYFSFGFPDATGVDRDLSAFAGGDLRFDIRVPATAGVGGAVLRLRMDSLGAPAGACGGGALNCEEIDLGLSTTFDDAFHSVTIPLSTFTGGGVVLADMETISFTAVNQSGSYDFYLDNLRFEP